MSLQLSAPRTIERMDTERTDRYWRALMERDSAFDGVIYFGVRTTGVYCRPVCGARKPNRENVEFFDSIAEAERAGFRPCKRCRPREEHKDARAALVEAATRDIEANLESGDVSLASVSERLGCSQFHLQRTFKALTGVSPRQFTAARRLERLKHGLQQGSAVTTALYDAGYGSSSPVYDASGPNLGMTPTRYQRAGEQLSIGYAIKQCAFGLVLAAATERGICTVRIGDDADRLLAGLREEFAAAEIAEDESLGIVVDDLLASLAGGKDAAQLPLDIRMTTFQQRVWQALQAIPAGETRSYADVARSLGAPTAARAVASACAANPVALLVPCHRVIRGNGELGGYRWGIERKRQILDLERREAVAMR